MIKLTTDGTDITAITGNYQRSDNIDALGQEFTFDLASNPLDKNFLNLDISVGSKISVKNGDTDIFQGIVVKYDRNELQKFTYHCFDYAFYLNKSEARIQFNDISVKDAIEKLCEQENVPVDIKCSIDTKVTKIFNGEVLSKIITDLLKLDSDVTGIKYRYEYNSGKIEIDKRTNLIIEAKYQPVNGTAFDATEVIGSFRSSYSIEDMKNKIVIISSSQKNQQIEATEIDDTSKQQYGQLVHYEKLDDKKKAEATNIAKVKLKELNKVKESFTVQLLGDDSVRSGRCLKFNQKELKFEGTFLIKNCKHHYKGNIHTMELDLVVSDDG